MDPVLLTGIYFVASFLTGLIHRKCNGATFFQGAVTGLLWPALGIYLIVTGIQRVHRLMLYTYFSRTNRFKRLKLTLMSAERQLAKADEAYRSYERTIESLSEATLRNDEADLKKLQDHKTKAQNEAQELRKLSRSLQRYRSVCANVYNVLQNRMLGTESRWALSSDVDKRYPLLTLEKLRFREGDQKPVFFWRWHSQEQPGPGSGIMFKYKGLSKSIPEINVHESEWSYSFSPKFGRSAKKIDNRLHETLIEAIVDTIKDPIAARGNSVTPLTGNHKGAWRRRVGDYRILYWPDISDKSILFSSIEHRSKAY